VTTALSDWRRNPSTAVLFLGPHLDLAILNGDLSLHSRLAHLALDLGLDVGICHARFALDVEPMQLRVERFVAGGLQFEPEFARAARLLRLPSMSIRV